MTKLITQIRIARNDQSVWIYGPYNPGNHAPFKLRNGKLDATKPSNGEKPWKFARTAATDAMIVELFGSDSPLVRVLLKDENVTKGAIRWRIGGYLLATTMGRDRGVDMPTGVQLEQGSWLPSGGSMKHPIIQDDEVVLSVVVRREFAERRKLEIIAKNTPSQPEALSPLARLADEELLAECRRRGLLMFS